ncbi:sensor histidine kinase [Candidatus Sulfurimonas baltica]|uniref:histidine kinase n=1 Tax=Candidatus Sulfurimonas baltica TaxID=2740404 RepID=A0A7S7LVU9_9BACT|nr:sensor histidine kinase [Candidatus Sulfurimonas baltica]QOY52267.1 sensor histidine kinase [Candidatus Sulfurimonas baltica]
MLTASLFAHEEMRIGVRAYNGKEAAIKKWGETVNALNKEIHDHNITVVPIVTFKDMEKAVEEQTIDFILTNPTEYVAFEVRDNVRRITTLINHAEEGGLTQFSSIIFTKADRDDINFLQDTKGKSILGLKKQAFGAWQMAHKEFLDNGIDPFEDLDVKFNLASTQQEIVYAVLNGKADLGTVRTGVMERLIKDGKILTSEIKVINVKVDKFPLLHSTSLYPEWAFASLPHVPLELTNKVAIALLQIKPDDEAALQGGYTGWTTPLEYTVVSDILKQLKVFPYENHGKITLELVWQEYKYTLLLLSLGVLSLMIYNAHVNSLNERLERKGKKLKETNVELEKATLELSKFSKELEKRVTDEVAENMQKDRLVYQQSKMASMGEMIGNIAHQWRQPIAIISMWANNIIADIDMGNIENEQLRKYANSINAQTQHLSQTIDDFRNFFAPNKEKKTFTLKNSIDKTMSLLTASFKTHSIELIENIEEIEITALENELTQGILNIIKNAKDILVTLPRESRKLIFVNVYKQGNRAIIEIKDSGGGIPENIIDKVFEPYFTTKHKSQGTGIGLYMTESIITKHLHGEISVENSEYDYEGKHYKGAVFAISLPTSEEKG